jgi:pilus assembly protein Flp/PilA
LIAPRNHGFFAVGREANEESSMTKLAWRFLRDQSGATSIEYAAIASLLSIAIVTAVTGLGSKLKISYTTVSNAFN